MIARRFLSRFDVDETIFYGTGRLVLNALSSLLMLVFVARTLSREAQGFFYAFYSFFQIQAVLQAGAYLSLYAAISHAWAHLSVDAQGRIAGPAQSLERLGGMLRLSQIWHWGCAAAFAVLLGPLGHLFFALKDAKGVPWIGPWWALSFMIAGSFLILPNGLALESTGHTGAQQKAQFYGVLASAVAGPLALTAGLGLYAVAVMTLARVATTAVLYYPPTRKFRRLPAARLDWRDEILPQQMRLTVSWLLGFFVFLAAVPITFQAAGPAVAGRVGVAVQIYQAVNSIAGVWISRAQPRMGALAARREMAALNRLVRTAATRASAVAAVLGAGAAGLVFALGRWAPTLAARLPDAPVVLLYVSVAALGQWPGAMTTAVRLTRAEPFIPTAAAGAVATLVGYALLAPRLGELGVGIGFFAVTVLLVFPWTALIYRDRMTVDAAGRV
jgi:hypothetical protein